MNNKRLEERIDMLETDVACIRETNKEFFDMHKSEEEINQYHIELFNDMDQRMEWLNGAITLLSFATAGLLIGLIGSHAKIAAIKKNVNEG